MGKFYEEIPDDPKLLQWISEQKLYHVATAPLNGGHVNVSPKGQDSFKIVNRKACWYLDLTGSGNETISHLYEPGNGRLTILFEAFEGPPRILRLFGKGRVIERGTKEFDDLMNPEYTHPQADTSIQGFPTPELLPGARAIIWLDITRVGTSCGYAVPFMKFESHRNTLNDWAGKREKIDEETGTGDLQVANILPPQKGLKYYWVSTNSWSIDGLPGMHQVTRLATSALISDTMSGAGLPAGMVSRRAASVGWVVAWVFGLLLGTVLYALLDKGTGGVLRGMTLHLPANARSLLDFTK
ncbi:hypothetical protein EIP86_005002 [Pleurotus ostreatoroseus]|nr:hypothetical protein EIP86_005002 [Pleurotus ostreatoroseus]